MLRYQKKFLLICFAIMLITISLMISNAALADNKNCHYMPHVKIYQGPKISKFGIYHGYSTATYNSWIRKSQYLTMPDGRKLALDIILPAHNCQPTKKKSPVILLQTPYQRVYQGINGELVTQVEHHGLQTLIRHGYIFSVVAMSGTAASFGIFKGLSDPSERKDAYTVIEWLAKQEFSNGKIGMLGDSYQGVAQWLATSEHPPHLRAIFPETAPFDLYQFAYPGGIFREPLFTYLSQLIHNMNSLNQLVPVDKDPNGTTLLQARNQHQNNANILKQLKKVKYSDGKTYNFSWAINNPINRLKAINQSEIPAYISDSWYDLFIADSWFWLKNYTGPKKMLIGFWPHNTYSAPKAIAAERQRINTVEALRWFDYWLKGIDNGIMSQPAINYNIIKQDYLPYKWLSADKWPPKTQPKNLYLHKQHLLSSKEPKTGSDSPDNYTVNYTTSTGHLSRWNNANGQGFINYSGLTLNDTKSLIYTSKPLNKDTVVLGFPTITLFISSSTEDVDIHVVLEEVDAKGISHYLTEGMLRASHRKLSKATWKNYSLPYQSHEESDMELIQPSQIVKLQFYLYPFARVLHKNNQLRIAIMAADMNNTRSIFFPKASVVTVFHNKPYPSNIKMPIFHIGEG